MSLLLSNDEIVTRYRQAKDPQKQIGILADMCLCKKKDIVDVLREAGCELPKRYQKKAAPSEEPEQEDLSISELEELLRNSEAKAAWLEGALDLMVDQIMNLKESMHAIADPPAIIAVSRLLGMADLYLLTQPE